MSDVKDYCNSESESGNTHYKGVPSAYGESVAKQTKMQPTYCEPGKSGDTMKGEKRNEQAGP